MANQMPPVPRDHDEASFSEIVPIRSGKISLFKSPLFIFGIVTAIATVLLFGLMQGLMNAPTPQERYGVFRSLTMVITAYLLLLTLFAIFLYSRTDRKIWYFAFPVVVICILLTPPFLRLFFFVFREMLPGGSNLTGSPIFFNAFIGMFFGAGLMEELMKAVAVLFGASLTIFAARMRSVVPGTLYDLLRVRGPLDGILMGVAAGAGFIFIETWDQYVPNIVAQVFKATKGNDLGAFGLGLMLLFPRVINGLAGHMAYAGIFGYFIGLAVVRPRKAPMLLLIGWLTAAILHALWNSVGTIWGGLSYVVAAATVIVLVACLLKARQLEASIFGRSVETSGSIIVGMPGSGQVPGMAPAPQWGGQAAPPSPPQWGAAAPRPAQWGAPAGGFPGAPPPGGFPGAMPGGAPGAYPGAPPQQPYPYPASQAATTPMQPTMPVQAALALHVAGANVPLTPGARIDLSMIPALGERGRGLVGEVSVHPRNPGVIGLKNLGNATWYARLRDGSVQPVEPQRNVRLAGGISIDFGGGIQGAVVG
ncbi:PrsW family intramembrane metalloprotease [Vineibacter terrae]|uniref:PrsW family intramembrane metalloprotease n=1 Tax=Vineibacter terrae TaxID=2586908 RepID=A0A5C8PPK2_9HYPH|nr:PrsW family intramembrane metalloprotease [Vineibacter terrae]TXL76343.1 PrsW family intramembrane metalloprotease [Vineibacter terrae]